MVEAECELRKPATWSTAEANQKPQEKLATILMQSDEKLARS